MALPVVTFARERNDDICASLMTGTASGPSDPNEAAV